MKQMETTNKPLHMDNGSRDGGAGDDEYRSKAVVIATGAKARQLGLPSEQALQGRGVTYCAVCDGAFYREKDVIVVGGGDSAMEEAIFLTRFAAKVTIVHRRDEFRASQIMLERARSSEKIEFITNAVVEEVLGVDEGEVTGVRLRDVHTDEVTEVPAQGFFVAIGHEPNTELFLDQLDHDEAGYLLTRDRSTATNVPGVFAAGDVRHRSVKRVASAVGEGAVAVQLVHQYLGRQ